MTDLNMPIAGCFCRILNDGYFAGQLVADSRDQAIERFLSGAWIHQ